MSASAVKLYLNGGDGSVLCTDFIAFVDFEQDVETYQGSLDKILDNSRAEDMLVEIP